MLEIYPDKIKNFANEYRNPIFYVIVTEFLCKEIVLKPSQSYTECKLIICRAHEKISDILKTLRQQDADILFIPHLYSDNPFPLQSDLTGMQRFLILACTQSTPVTLETIHYFLNLIYETDLRKFEEKAENFYRASEFADEIEFIDKKHSTLATLKIDDKVLLSEICGNLEPRQIGVIPCGEIAFTHKNFNGLSPISLNGDITLRGHSILQCCTYTQEAFDYRQKLFSKLISLHNNAMVITVNDGQITSCHALSKGAKKAVQVLNELFETDSRYRIVIEIGIGLNNNLKMVDYNSSMNETYGGDDMCIHFGIGIEPLLFHLDIICPDTQLKIKTGEVLVKGSSPILQLQNAGACPCNQPTHIKQI